MFWGPVRKSAKPHARATLSRGGAAAGSNPRTEDPLEALGCPWYPTRCASAERAKRPATPRAWGGPPNAGGSPGCAGAGCTSTLGGASLYADGIPLGKNTFRGGDSRSRLSHPKRFRTEHLLAFEWQTACEGHLGVSGSPSDEDTLLWGRAAPARAAPTAAADGPRGPGGRRERGSLRRRGPTSRPRRSTPSLDHGHRIGDIGSPRRQARTARCLPSSPRSLVAGAADCSQCRTIRVTRDAHAQTMSRSKATAHIKQLVSWQQVKETHHIPVDTEGTEPNCALIRRSSRTANPMPGNLRLPQGLPSF